MDFLILFILYLFISAFVILSIIPIYKEHKKSTGNIKNFDSTMRKFVFKTQLSKVEIIQALQTKNIYDNLGHAIYPNETKIVFTDFNDSVSFSYVIDEYDGFTIVRLKQIPFITSSNYIAIKINPFMIFKINAQIIPYFEN